MTKKLYVLSEGELHNLLYLVRNKIIPDYYIQEPIDLRKYIPYLSNDDDILVIIQGMTDFKMVELYSIIHDIITSDIKARVTVMSSVKLLKFPMTYYLYEGDLFYSKVLGITNENVVDLDVSDAKQTKTNKKQINSKLAINKVMNPFLYYSSEKEVDIVTDTSFTKKELKKEKSLYSDLVHKVNFYGGK